MAVVFNGLFGTAQSKVDDTSLQINPADIIVATGDDIFVAFGSDDVGSNHSVSDGGTASITWTLEASQQDTGNERAYLFRGDITSGGTLTDLTVSWTTNITAKAAVAGWYSGVGVKRGISADTRTGSTTHALAVDSSQIGWQTSDLVIGCTTWEIEFAPIQLYVAGTSLASAAMVAEDGTTGTPAGTNITCALVHGFANSGNAGGDALGTSTTNDSAGGAGAVYGYAGTPAVAQELSMQSHVFGHNMW